MKYEKAIPPTKSTVESATKTETVRCIRSSIAGARNDQSW